jgi:DNA-binding Lrp family transcriptional regulator
VGLEVLLPGGLVCLGYCIPELLGQLDRFREVQEACSITGDHDIILRVSVRDTEKLNELIERLEDIQGIEKARTFIILKGEENHIKL